jgi:hypothetical protein
MRDGDGLFAMEPVQPPERGKPTGWAAVDKRFRAFDPHQVLLLPPSLDDWLPQDHLARFIADLVDDVLDLTAIRADYTDKRGYPPYDPRLMLRLLIYGYTTGVAPLGRSSASAPTTSRSGSWPPTSARTSAPSPGSAAATWTPSRTCSPSHCIWRPSSAWSRWAASPWTARSWRPTPPSTKR